VPTEAPTQITARKLPGEPFFLVLAVLQFLVVLAGFSPSFYARSGSLAPLSVMFIWHGIVLTLWYVLVIVQSALLGLRYSKTTVRWHMRLGMLSLAIAALVIYSGIEVALTFYNSGTRTEILSPAGLLTANLLNLFGFLVCFALGMHWRKRKALHKRFLSLCGVVMIGPAAFRLVVFLGLAPPVSLVIQFGFLLALGWYDRKRLGRISAPCWTAVALILLLIAVTLAVG